MKRIFVLVFAAGVFELAGCATHVESVAVSYSKLMLEVGATETLMVYILPKDADDKTAVWSSDNPAVATVDAVTGEVTVVGEGTATITATTNDGGFTATCPVTGMPYIDVIARIPDAGFRAYCESKMEDWDADGDGRLSSVEAAKVVDINVYNNSYPISSLQGIEYFKGLRSLNCCDQGIDMTSLDVSANTVLESLNCGGNGLTSLDVSANTALTELQCWGNDLTSLDVSKCTELTWLRCVNNRLTSLDVSGCTALETLECRGNALTSLDVSECKALEILICLGNRLTSLDVSGCIALEGLDCKINDLAVLDLSGCSALSSLRCDSNKLTSLDVSKNVKLTDISCEDNPGNGVSFPVMVWFDDDYASSDLIYYDSWQYNGKTITVDYRKAE